MLKIVEHVGGF